MPQADGTVLIDTEINSDGMQAGTKEVEAAARRMAASVEDIGTKAKAALNKQVDSFAKLNQEYAAQAKKVDELRAKVQAYGDQKIPTEEYKEIKNQIAQAEQQMMRLMDAQEKFISTGGKDTSSAYKRRQYDIEQLANTIRYAEGELKDLEATGKAFTLGTDTSAAAADMNRLAEAERKLVDMNNRLGTSYSSIKGQVNDYNQSVLKAKSSNDKFNKSLKETNKSAKKGNMSIGKMLGTSILFSFVFRAISAVMTGVKEGFDNLAQYSGSTNRSLSMLMSSLTRLKNAFATAFAPILDVVAPILSRFIDMISVAVTAVGQLMAALTGKSTFTKAIAVQEDYAASLEDSASGAKDAEKAMEGYLSPLDEINKLETKDDSAAAGGGGGGASIGEMFEEVPVNPKILELAKKIKDFFQPIIDAVARLKGPVMNFLSVVGDTVLWLYETILEPLLTWLITTAIPKLIDILGKVLEILTIIIDWVNRNILPVIEPILTALVNAVIGVGDGILSVFDGIAEFLLGVFTGDWERAFNGLKQILSGFSQIVSSICDAVQVILDTLDSWLQAVFEKDWSDTFGVLGDVLNGFLSGVRNIWNGVKQIFDGIITFLRGTFSGNWSQAWEGIKQILQGVWNTIVGVVKAPINGVIGLINGMISSTVSGLNAVIDALNSISIRIPSWVPIYGGSRFGVNLGYVSAPQIPYLATGAVIPPNAPFMAVLGDQRNGNNLEMPENLLRRIIREESGKSGGGSYQFSAQINRRVLFDEFITEAKLRQSATGKNPLELA